MKDIPLAYRSRNNEQAFAHVIEEAGEVIAAAGKCWRFGFDSYNPELPENEREENIQWLIREILDLENAITQLRLLTNILPEPL